MESIRRRVAMRDALRLIERYGADARTYAQSLLDGCSPHKVAVLTKTLNYLGGPIVPPEREIFESPFVPGTLQESECLPQIALATLEGVLQALSVAKLAQGSRLTATAPVSKPRRVKTYREIGSGSLRPEGRDLRLLSMGADSAGFVYDARPVRGRRRGEDLFAYRDSVGEREARIDRFERLDRYEHMENVRDNGAISVSEYGSFVNTKSVRKT